MAVETKELDDFQHIGPQHRLRARAIESAVAEERERCAKICERVALDYQFAVGTESAMRCARQIRSKE